MAKIKTIELKGGVEVPVKHTSEYLSLGWKDGLRAALIAAGTPVIYALIDWLNNTIEPLDWKKALATGLSAGLMYLVKNYFTQSEVVISKDEL